MVPAPEKAEGLAAGALPNAEAWPNAGAAPSGAGAPKADFAVAAVGTPNAEVCPKAGLAKAGAVAVAVVEGVDVDCPNAEFVEDAAGAPNAEPVDAPNDDCPNVDFPKADAPNVPLCPNAVPPPIVEACPKAEMVEGEEVEAPEKGLPSTEDWLNALPVLGVLDPNALVEDLSPPKILPELTLVLLACVKGEPS